MVRMLKRRGYGRMKNSFSWYLKFHGDKLTKIPSNSTMTTQFTV